MISWMKAQLSDLTAIDVQLQTTRAQNMERRDCTTQSLLIDNR